MCYKQNRRFRSKRVQHDYSNKLIKNFNKTSKCKCKFNGRKCNSYQKWSNDKRWCECIKHISEKDYIWNSATCSCQNGKYLGIIFDDSVITCDKNIDTYTEAKSCEEETKTVKANFNESKLTCTMQSFYVLSILLWTNIALLIAVSIYCYLIKYKLPFHVTNNELLNVL